MFKKKNKEDLDKFNPLLKKEVIIIDKNEFEENVSKATKEIIDTLENDYGVNIQKVFSDIISEKIKNVIENITFYGNDKNMTIDGIIPLPYYGFAGKIDINTPEEFNMLSKALSLASEIKNK